MVLVVKIPGSITAWKHALNTLLNLLPRVSFVMIYPHFLRLPGLLSERKLA